MAAIVLKKAYLVVEANLSDFIQSITLNLTKEVPQSTAMGDDSHEYLADALKDGSFDVTFRSDYDAGAVDATLWSLYISTVAGGIDFVIRPSTDSKSTSNPEFTGKCHLTNYSPISGSVGDVATTPSNFQITGDVGRDASS